MWVEAHLGKVLAFSIELNHPNVILKVENQAEGWKLQPKNKLDWFPLEEFNFLTFLTLPDGLHNKLKDLEKLPSMELTHASNSSKRDQYHFLYTLTYGVGMKCTLSQSFKILYKVQVQF